MVNFSVSTIQVTGNDIEPTTGTCSRIRRCDVSWLATTVGPSFISIFFMKGWTLGKFSGLRRKLKTVSTLLPMWEVNLTETRVFLQAKYTRNATTNATILQVFKLAILLGCKSHYHPPSTTLEHPMQRVVILISSISFSTGYVQGMSDLLASLAMRTFSPPKSVHTRDGSPYSWTPTLNADSAVLTLLFTTALR